MTTGAAILRHWNRKPRKSPGTSRERAVFKRRAIVNANRVTSRRTQRKGDRKIGLDELARQLFELVIKADDPARYRLWPGGICHLWRRCVDAVEKAGENASIFIFLLGQMCLPRDVDSVLNEFDLLIDGMGWASKVPVDATI
jgi:hypothetical protein